MTKDRPNDEILFDGEPPLKRYIADSLQQVIERGLESTLTDEQRALFESQLIEEWQRGPESRAGIESTVTQFRSVVEQINALPLTKQPLGWRELGRHLYMYAEQHGEDNPVGQLILNTYRNKQMLLVEGSPPLSRQAAESYVEMSIFFHSILKRVPMDRIKLTPEQRTEAINELVRQFPTLSEENRDQISQSDILWGLLRYNWQRASLTEREKYRHELFSASREAAQKKEPKEPEATEAVEADSPPAETASPASPEALAKNSKFMEAIKKLRLNAPKSSPFQFRKR